MLNNDCRVAPPPHVWYQKSHCYVIMVLRLVTAICLTVAIVKNSAQTLILPDFLLIKTIQEVEMTHCIFYSHFEHRLRYNRQVEQKPGGRGREWATLGVHPLSWLLSNNRLEKVPFVSAPHTSSNQLLLSNQDKGCTPSVSHFLALPLGPALLNLWTQSQALQSIFA